MLATAGHEDTTIRTPAGSVLVAVEAVPVVDTIGAGGAFTAGFVTRWLASARGATTSATLLRSSVPACAHIVAAAVVARRGADPPRR